MIPAGQRLSERQLQDLVIATCGVLGLYVYHTYDSRRCVRGFPDLVIVGNRVLWRELKGWRTSSRPTREQTAVLSGLRDAGQDSDIWRPCDWFSGRITGELTAARVRRR